MARAARETRRPGVTPPTVAPRVELVGVGRLVKAPWNFKAAPEPDVMERLKHSILADASAGVLEVRELPKSGLLEVMNGNHRLDIILELGWVEVWVENFGPISKARAITIAERRNAEWFPRDDVMLGKLLKGVVLKEYDLADIASIMPRPLRELENLIKLADFDWADAMGSKPESLGAGSLMAMDVVNKGLWHRWQATCREKYGAKNSVRQLRIALSLALRACGEKVSDKVMLSGPKDADGEGEDDGE